MKQVLLFLTCALLFFYSPGQNLYNFTVNSSQGETLHLNTFLGKKVMFVILPYRSSDTTLLSPSALRSMQFRYTDSLFVIGVPALDAGYLLEDSTSLKLLYGPENPGFIYSEAMKVKKTSGNDQDNLFQWLTKVSENGHFDTDVKSVGYKFVIDQRGSLCAVLGPQVDLDDSLIDKIVSKSY